MKRRYIRRPWTPEEEAYMRENYADTPTADLARHLGRAYTAVSQHAIRLGLTKSPEYLRSTRLQPGQCIGKEHQFRPGQTPANKGLRRPGWAPGRMAETQFRRGARNGRAAQNWRPIGTILPDSEGYLRIKVREAEYGKEPCGFGNVQVWPLLHRRLWEQAHGPIPEGHLVVFRDGNRQNCVIENLMLMTMADNARRNSMWNLPRELAEVIQLQGALKRQLRKREKDATQHD